MEHYQGKQFYDFLRKKIQNFIIDSICQEFTVQVDEVETEGKDDEGKFLYIEFSLTEFSSDDKKVS